MRPLYTSAIEGIIEGIIFWHNQVLFEEHKMPSEKQGQMPNEAVIYIYIPAIEGPDIHVALLIDLE